jgi:hypothetical protein
MADIRSVAERLDATQIDLTRAHDLCKSGMKRIADKLFAAFDVARHPACDPFVDFSNESDTMRGSVTAYSGEQLDWVIHSWIGSPERGFTNHHLTVWLPSSIPVPHLAMAVGTIPEVFCFCDLVPRSDLWVDTDSLDQYFEPLSERFMAVAADPRFVPFISRSTYIREAISPIGLCKTCDANEQNITDILAMFEDTLDRWIVMVKEAAPTPIDARAALGRRDRLVRETICDRDPANIVAEKVLGADTTQQLVDLLSAKARNR